MECLKLKAITQIILTFFQLLLDLLFYFFERATTTESITIKNGA